MAQFGHVQFTFNRRQLESLSACLQCNAGLSEALFVFFDTEKMEPTCDEMLNWLRHSEKISAA